MTKTQLNLGIELNQKIKALELSRSKYKNGFDMICNSEEQSQEIKLLEFNGTIDSCHEFPKLELQKLFEYRIKQIDFQLEELNQKFNQL